MFLCMYVAFDISKRSLSVYVASLLGPHLQTVIFPRAESLDMEELINIATYMYVLIYSEIEAYRYLLLNLNHTALYMCGVLCLCCT